MTFSGCTFPVAATLQAARASAIFGSLRNWRFALRYPVLGGNDWTVPITLIWMLLCNESATPDRILGCWGVFFFLVILDKLHYRYVVISVENSCQESTVFLAKTGGFSFAHCYRFDRILLQGSCSPRVLWVFCVWLRVWWRDCSRYVMPFGEIKVRAGSCTVYWNSNGWRCSQLVTFFLTITHFEHVTLIDCSKASGAIFSRRFYGSLQKIDIRYSHQDR